MTNVLAAEPGGNGPVFVSVNPGSLLGTKVVRDAFGKSGNDVGIGDDILTRAALSADFADASGRYYDNDLGRFAPPPGRERSCKMRSCQAGGREDTKLARRR